MTDMHTVRAKGPADLLALVPSLLGFHPEESVVVLTVGAATQPFHARVDLPTDPVGVEDLAAYLTDVVRRNGVKRLASIVYSDDAGLAEALGRELDGRLLAASVDLVCLVRADGERWWPVCGDPDVDGCQGTPYDVTSHPLMAQAVMDGTAVLGSRQELVDSLVGNDPEETERISLLGDQVVARLALHIDAPLGRASGRHQLGLEGRWVRHRVCRFLADEQRLDEHDVARLAALISISVEIRDVAWAEMSHENARGHVDLWRDVVRRAPVGVRAAPAALLGFAAWISGDGALAWCAVECAQGAEPDYSMAGLLSTALAGAVPPSAWQPFPREALTLFAG